MKEFLPVWANGDLIVGADGWVICSMDDTIMYRDERMEYIINAINSYIRENTLENKPEPNEEVVFWTAYRRRYGTYACGYWRDYITTTFISDTEVTHWMRIEDPKRVKICV